ncbi:MAG TPA: hypothetical protein VMU66_06135 [Gaiellales bacterium]|nr:hypothetical protein [Gaiellales bacterium]
MLGSWQVLASRTWGVWSAPVYSRELKHDDVAAGDDFEMELFVFEEDVAGDGTGAVVVMPETLKASRWRGVGRGA